MVECHLSAQSLRGQEDQLFKDWSARAGYPLIRDGAMAQYADAPRRLLVMLKEPNDPEHAFLDGDLREAASWYDDADFRRETWTTIARWTASLLDGRTIYGPVPSSDWSALLSRIAVVNLKKTGGGGAADHRAIEAFIATPLHARMLRQQLKLYAPHLTICGSDFVADGLARLHSWPIESWRRVRRGGREDEIWELDSPILGRVISFWHPAQRIRRADELVRMLQEIGRETMLALGSHLDASPSQSS